MWSRGEVEPRRSRGEKELRRSRSEDSAQEGRGGAEAALAHHADKQRQGEEPRWSRGAVEAT